MLDCSHKRAFTILFLASLSSAAIYCDPLQDSSSRTELSRDIFANSKTHNYLYILF